MKKFRADFREKTTQQNDTIVAHIQQMVIGMERLV
jgi:hypothetical protein